MNRGGRSRIGTGFTNSFARLGPWRNQGLYTSRKAGAQCGNGVREFFPNPAEEPILKEVLKVYYSVRYFLIDREFHEDDTKLGALLHCDGVHVALRDVIIS